MQTWLFRPLLRISGFSRIIPSSIPFRRSPWIQIVNDYFCFHHLCNSEYFCRPTRCAFFFKQLNSTHVHFIIKFEFCFFVNFLSSRNCFKTWALLAGKTSLGFIQLLQIRRIEKNVLTFFCFSYAISSNTIIELGRTSVKSRVRI